MEAWILCGFITVFCLVMGHAIDPTQPPAWLLKGEGEHPPHLAGSGYNGEDF